MNKYIKDQILSDVRESDPKYSKNIINIEGWNNLEIRQDIYRKKRFKPDAERWYGAISSYMKYPIFKKWEKLKDNSGYPILGYKTDDKEVFLPADLLTNPMPIIAKYNEMVKKNNKLFNNKKVLYSFLKVSYTPGNFSPVWYNLGNGPGNNNDTIWYKLDRYILQVEKFIGINNKCVEMYKNLKKRQSNCQIFDVLFTDTEKKKDIIDALLFQDFFDNDCLLQSTKIPNEEEKFLEYIYDTTKCIISRGYRILAKDKPEQAFTDNDLKNINCLCKEIGNIVTFD